MLKESKEIDRLKSDNSQLSELGVDELIQT